MKKRIITLLLFIFLTTGCNANYNLVIENESIIETTTFTQEENAFYTKSYMFSQFQEEYPIYYDEEFLYYAPNEKVKGNTYYEKKIMEISNGYEAIYKANYNINNYKRSRLLNLAYENFSVGYDDVKDYYFLIANNLKIFNSNNYLDNITVTIDLKGYEVLECNYHSRNGTIYMWNFDRNNKGNINLRYKKTINNNVSRGTSASRSSSVWTTTDRVIRTTSASNNQNNTSFNNYGLYIFLVIIILVVIFGYVWFNKMKERNNTMGD